MVTWAMLAWVLEGAGAHLASPPLPPPSQLLFLLRMSSPAACTPSRTPLGSSWGAEGVWDVLWAAVVRVRQGRHAVHEAPRARPQLVCAVHPAGSGSVSAHCSVLVRARPRGAQADLVMILEA